MRERARERERVLFVPLFNSSLSLFSGDFYFPDLLLKGFGFRV